MKEMTDLLLKAPEQSHRAVPLTGERGVQMDIFLLVGQANMAGRGPVPKRSKGVLPKTYLLNEADEWEPARHPLNRYSTIRKSDEGLQGFGPGGDFAAELIRLRVSSSVGLIVNCRGGTRIDEWLPGTRYFDEAARRASTTSAAGEISAILWHQGESDAENPEYLSRLTSLIAGFRNEIGACVPFVAGQVHQADGVNQQIAQLPQVAVRAQFVSSAGLSVVDRWHFDVESMRALGIRYAVATAELLRGR